MFVIPESSLREATESSLRHVVGDNTLEETLTTGREMIAQDVDARLQSYLRFICNWACSATGQYRKN